MNENKCPSKAKVKCGHHLTDDGKLGLCCKALMLKPFLKNSCHQNLIDKVRFKRRVRQVMHVANLIPIQVNEKF